MKDEYIEVSQDIEYVLSNACPEDLVAVKPEEVSELTDTVYVGSPCQLSSSKDPSNFLSS